VKIMEARGIRSAETGEGRACGAARRQTPQ
jgi:hypothetical protein